MLRGSMHKELATSRRFVVVLGLLTGLVAFAIDICLPAIPPMVENLGTTMPTGQQVVGLFLAGIAVGQLPFGLMSDRLGRLPVLYAGISLFTIAGIATSLADGIGVMLVARFVQGIGSSAGLVLARAIVRDIASGADAARLMSIMVMIFTAAPMLAPMFGSFLVSTWGWRVPFGATVVAGMLVLYGINTSLSETHTPKKSGHILRQLWNSLKLFFTHRQSIYGVLLIMTTVIGSMAVVSGSAAMIIEIYGIPVQYFGLFIAINGVAILAGSSINRRLLTRFGALQMIGAGATIACIAALQLLFMAWQGEADLRWFWGSVILYMVGHSLLVPNATAMALDPVPEIAGVAASVIGTSQSLAGATSAIVCSSLYAGTIVNVSSFVGVAGVTAFVLFGLRQRFLRSAPVHGLQG